MPSSSSCVCVYVCVCACVCMYTHIDKIGAFHFRRRVHTVFLSLPSNLSLSSKHLNQYSAYPCTLHKSIQPPVPWVVTSPENERERKRERERDITLNTVPPRVKGFLLIKCRVVGLLSTHTYIYTCTHTHTHTYTHTQL